MWPEQLEVVYLPDPCGPLYAYLGRDEQGTRAGVGTVISYLDRSWPGHLSPSDLA